MTKNLGPDLHCTEGRRERTLTFGCGTRVSVPQHVLARELAGESVLLNLDSGHYFGLDAVGTRMWALLVEHGEVEAAYRALLDEYDVEEEQLRKDLTDLVEDLVSQKLLRIDET
jgi:hypothetical protein